MHTKIKTQSHDVLPNIDAKEEHSDNVSEDVLRFFKVIPTTSTSAFPGDVQGPSKTVYDPSKR
jgi:hypothetical protein